MNNQTSHAKRQALKTIKELRLLSGAGVMDCRRALKKTKGDLSRALKVLQKEGEVIVAKKVDRKTEEGLVASYIHANGRVGAMVTLLCETDFVARTVDFKNLAHELTMQVAAMDPASVEELLGQEYIKDSKLKIRDLVKQMITKTGENIRIGKFTRMVVNNS